MNNSIKIEDIKEHFDKDKHLIFGYTPMCGTCKISERMLDIANDIEQLPLKKIDFIAMFFIFPHNNPNSPII